MHKTTLALLLGTLLLVRAMPDARADDVDFAVTGSAVSVENQSVVLRDHDPYQIKFGLSRIAGLYAINVEITRKLQTGVPNLPSFSPTISALLPGSHTPQSRTVSVAKPTTAHNEYSNSASFGPFSLPATTSSIQVKYVGPLDQSGTSKTVIVTLTVNKSHQILTIQGAQHEINVLSGKLETLQDKVKVLEQYNKHHRHHKRHKNHQAK